MELAPVSTISLQKCYVTYTAPSPDPFAPSITLSESPYLLASTGTTGFRTWEASLYLASYLYLAPPKHSASQKNIIELGAGTGLVSILCSKHLNATRVLATDGSADVVTEMEVNARLNGVGHDARFQTFVFKWGHSLLGRLADCGNQKRPYNLVLGADLVGLLWSLFKLSIEECIKNLFLKA